MLIKCTVEHQTLRVTQNPEIASGTKGYVKCVFDFLTDDWEGTVKTAYFRGTRRKIYGKILDAENSCIVPQQAVQDPGIVDFAVIGEKENYRITTIRQKFYNAETVYGGDPTQPPDPDQYDQIIALFENTLQIAQSVRDDADAGKFTGPPGPEGPQGPRGDSGITFPASGFFTMHVDEDGNLYVTTADQGTPPPFVYNQETGELYWDSDQLMEGKNNGTIFNRQC